MRKLMNPALWVTLFSLVAWAGGADACGDKSTGNKSASAGCAGKTMDAKAAGTASCDAMKSAAAGEASLSCPGAGNATAAMKANCAAHCAAAKSAGMVSNDAFINAYMQVEKGLVSGCGYSTSAAVSAWRASIKEAMASKTDQADAQSLAKLDASLAAWPSEIADQRQAFAGVSEWLIGYCQSFPERAAGTTIAKCPDSGRRWVETADVKGNPYSG